MERSGSGKGTDGCGTFGGPIAGCGVSAARFERDEAYRAMRRAIPDLEKPAAERGALSEEQARTVERYQAAEEQLRIRRDDVREHGVHQHEGTTPDGPTWQEGPGLQLTA